MSFFVAIAYMPYDILACLTPYYDEWDSSKIVFDLFIGQSIKFKAKVIFFNFESIFNKFKYL